MTALRIRPATARDAPALAAILNPIVRAGGTTAMEVELSEAEVAAGFVAGPAVLSCLAAEGAEGRLHGFQTLARHPELPEDWADIATFAGPAPRPSGVGAALFAATRATAARLGLAAINATIRADNARGLAYYARMGFETYAVAPAVPLADGTAVDRISKRVRL